MRRTLLRTVIGLAVMTMCWLTVRISAVRHVQSELRAAQMEINSRRIEQARTRLTRLDERWPGRGDVTFLMGSCEMILRHNDAALEAWGRVPPSASEAPLAALSRGRLACEVGRYRLAEGCLQSAIAAGGEIGEEGWRLMAWLYWITGRRSKYAGTLRRDIERVRDPSSILHNLWALDADPYTAGTIKETLEKALQSVPDDDLVWLGLADLATRTGRFDDAGKWLARCEQARPDDPDLWNARLEWARSAHRPAEFLRAAQHLPAAGLNQARALELRAWMAAQGGDHRAERLLLADLLALEPANGKAIERLADLAAQAGERPLVAELRNRKATIDRDRHHYKQLMTRSELAPLAPDFARTAQAIGRSFDARAWWRLAVQRDRSLESEAAAAEARLARAEPPPVTGNGTIAELFEPRDGVALAQGAGGGDANIPIFVDDAQERGLAFVFDNGRSDLRQLPETMSGGVGVIDFDGDGWLDVFAVQGGPFPPPPGRVPFGDRLFRNRGDGRFDDVTATAGLKNLPGGYGHGVAIGDYDNDGRPDIFITRWRSYALYHNAGGGRFEDVTRRVGLGGDRDWPTSAAWADLDNDGDLDLYVCHYLQWDAEHPIRCPVARIEKPTYDYCDVSKFPALPDHVYRNDGGRFVDVTRQAGMVDPDGRGLGVIAADFDDDGRVDLLVTNDTTANYFWHNEGGFRFTESGLNSGLGASASGTCLAGMGIACGDFDGDGQIDLAVTNFFNESTTLYHNHGQGFFSDRSSEAGLAAATRLYLGFGLAALDANNDGQLDLIQSNGHVFSSDPSVPSMMRSQLFLGQGQGKLADVSEHAGPACQVLRYGRGLAVGDFDNDGRTDAVIVSENAPLALFHNLSVSRNHFLVLQLEGTTSNRDAVGARVAMTAGGKTQVATRFGGGSYLSASGTRIHFGLGAASKADRVEVKWPSGRRDCYLDVTADAAYRLREGDPTPRPLPGFAAPSR